MICDMFIWLFILMEVGSCAQSCLDGLDTSICYTLLSIAFFSSTKTVNFDTKLCQQLMSKNCSAIESCARLGEYVFPVINLGGCKDKHMSKTGHLRYMYILQWIHKFAIDVFLIIAGTIECKCVTDLTRSTAQSEIYIN